MIRALGPGVAPHSVVVAQLAFIGDMVFATPLLQSLRRLWPATRLTVVGRPAALEVLEDHPAQPELLAYDKDREGGLRSLVATGRRIRALQPELFLGVSRSARTAWLARSSGAARRVGFAGPAMKLAYSDTIDRADDTTPFAQRPLRLLRPLGVEPAAERLRLAVSAARLAASREQLTRLGWSSGRWLAIAPGAFYATKRWPEEHYRALLERIERETEWLVGLYGGPQEEPLMERLAQGRSRVVIRRAIGIRGVLAELPHASAFLGGDSGPAHMARALNVPTLILHGPTDPVALHDGRPYPGLQLGIECQPCSPHGDARCPLGHHRCLVELTPELVFERLGRWFDGGPR